MTVTDADLQAAAADKLGRLWVLRRVWPYIKPVIPGLVPCPDLIARYRVRRFARRKLVTLRTWPEMAAKSEEVAQLAMLRMLDLQAKTRRAAILRQGEAAAMLARSSVETLILGLYCLRKGDAIEELNAASLKALADALAYLTEADRIAGTGILTEEVLRQCVANLGRPSRTYPRVMSMVTAIDNANGNTAARSIYRSYYGPLSNFTVHASGGTLMRHVRPDGRLRRRAARSASKLSSVRIADAATGVLAADLARAAAIGNEFPERYATRHSSRAILPVLVLAFGGMGGTVRKLKFRQSSALIKETFRYLWQGRAASDSVEERAAFVRERFAALLDVAEAGLPPGALDPFIDHVALMLAQLVPDSSSPDG